LDHRSVQTNGETWTEARRLDVGSTSSVHRRRTHRIHYAKRAYLSNTTTDTNAHEMSPSTCVRYHGWTVQYNNHILSPVCEYFRFKWLCIVSANYSNFQL